MFKLATITRGVFVSLAVLYMSAKELHFRKVSEGIPKWMIRTAFAWKGGRGVASDKWSAIHVKIFEICPEDWEFSISFING